MRTEDARTGFGSAAPRRTTPYSVSVPHTFATATDPAYRCVSGVPVWNRLKVLTCGDAFDLASTGCLVTLGEQRADEHDPLALLAGDLRPVVGVGGVREILVLSELLPD